VRDKKWKGEDLLPDMQDAEAKRSKMAIFFLGVFIPSELEIPP
jgi:hypothetical protein